MTTAIEAMNVQTSGTWPRLPLDEWAPTYQTLHRWMQIVGKTRLAHAPMVNHWWQVTLYLTDRGLTTSPIPYNGRSFEIEFDFFDHRLLARTSDGDAASMPLVAQPVADFYSDYLSALRSIGVEPGIRPIPSEMADVLPFTEDRIHGSYDPDAGHRCWQILEQSDRVFKEFRGRFIGKCSPVHFWWGGFDLACTRFSGRRAPVHPGGIPNLPDRVTREGYSHQCFSVGWWPGSIGGPVAEPAYYAYTYAEPEGCAVARVKPSAAYYHDQMHEWFLPYESVRTASDPRQELLSFLQSTYEVAADLGGWDRGALERQGT
jgi:hypothetical protein